MSALHNHDTEHLASLGRVAASVSHEFNNVLMAIQPFVDLIDRFATDDRCKKAAAQIRRSVKRGRQITDEVRVFTRAATPPTLRSVSLKRFLAAAAEQIRCILRSDVELDVTCASPALSMVCDSEQITQAVMNLCINAQDAMPEAGRITIAAGAAGHASPWVEIVVRDTGSGMDETTLAQIFEPLFTTKRHGMGLGLPVVRQIVERHGGTVRVRSAAGEGSEFRLLLPRGGAAGATEPPPDRASDRVRTSRILLVEDDLAVATGIAEVLVSYGMQVHTIYTGTNALKAALLFSPDLLILDINLPDRNGMLVYGDIRGEIPRLPVIFSTGHGEESLLKGIDGDGRVGFLRKPYDVQALLNEIDRLC